MYVNVRDNFSNYTVYACSKHTFSIPLMLNFSFLVFLEYLGAFAFSVFLFCHPIGGNDSPRKRKIYEEAGKKQKLAVRHGMRKII